MTPPKIHSIKNESPEGTHSLVMGVPSTGKIRFEWHTAIQSLSYPSMWKMSWDYPIGYDVATARNLIVEKALTDGSKEWLFFIDHDVLLPENTPHVLRRNMASGKYPIFSGLYYTKSSTPEPLVYRDGDGPYYDWEPGESVWAAYAGMGMALIHISVFKNMQPPWFVTPRSHIDMLTVDGQEKFKEKESSSSWKEAPSSRFSGTEDSYFYSRIVEEEILQKAGWNIPDPEYPILVDTSFLGGHIAFDSGKVYPNCMGDAHMVNHNATRDRIERRKSKRW